MSRFPLWYAPGTHGARALPSGWDLALVNKTIVSGRALITGLDVALKIDPRKKKGANAAHPTSHGLDVSEGQMRVVVWTRDQMDEVDELIAEICPPVNLQPVTLDHPQVRSLIRLLGKLDVMVKGCSAWHPSSVVARGYEVTFKLLHWPAAQRVKGKSTTPDRPKNLITGAAASASNPLPTASSSFCGPPVSASGA